MYHALTMAKSAWKPRVHFLALLACLVLNAISVYGLEESLIQTNFEFFLVAELLPLHAHYYLMRIRFYK